MTHKTTTWANLTPEETLKAAGYLYRDLTCLIVFGIFKNGSVGTLFTSNSSPMQLMWTLKAMDWDAVSDSSSDPLPLTEAAYNEALANLNTVTPHPVTTQALEQMQGVEHVIIAALTKEFELTMATSSGVNFMINSFCVDWFRHQLLNQMHLAAMHQQSAQQPAPQGT